MTKTIQIRVDKKLQDVLEEIRNKIAGDIKREYGLEKITIHGTTASRIVAAQMKGQKIINFKIKKQGLNHGVLELIY